MLRHFTFLFLLLCLLFVTGCASMKITPDNSLKVPGTLQDQHDIASGDKILTVQPVVPLFGTINAGQTTGFAGAVTGVTVTKIHQRFGTLQAEGLYYLTFNGSDNADLEHPYPFGKLPKIGYRLSYDVPLFRLRRTQKVMPIILATSGTTYLYTDMEVPRERLISLRAGLAGGYMSRTFRNWADDYFQYPDAVRVYQIANSLKTGIVFSQTSNTSFTATVMDPRFNEPFYHGLKCYRHEAYLDIDCYLFGTVKPVLTGTYDAGQQAIVYTETDPRTEFLQLQKIGFEAGYRWMSFLSKHGMLTVSLALGKGTGYIETGSQSYFMKARIQFGFGSIRNAN